MVDEHAPCSFCGTSASAATKFVYGPPGGICDQCVRKAETVVRNEAAGGGFEVLSGVCSFCSLDTQVASAGGARICDACLVLCDEVLEPESEERRRRRMARQQSYVDEGRVRVVRGSQG